MKKLVWILAGFCLCAQAADSQKEQWLRYNSSPGGRGYRYVKVSTNAPAGVALPKLNSKAWFGKWETPFDPSGGRWVCVDTSGKSKYDRLFIDLNGNGRLDDESPVQVQRSDVSSTYFQPVKIVFKGEDGPITYHIAPRFYKYGEGPANLLLSSAGFYSGTVDFAGKKYTIELIDGNVNGTFNDTGSGGDRIVFEGNRAGERYMGRLVEVDNKFYEIEVPRDGAFIKVKAAQNVTLGKVAIPATIKSVAVLGQTGHFVRSPKDGGFTIPAGEYQVLSWDVTRKDSSGSEWTMSGYNFPEKFSFEAADGTPADLKVGEPVQIKVEATDRPNAISFDLKFLGPQGEAVRFSKGNSNPKAPRMILASTDGTYRSTNTFEFG